MTDQVTDGVQNTEAPTTTTDGSDQAAGVSQEATTEAETSLLGGEATEGQSEATSGEEGQSESPSDKSSDEGKSDSDNSDEDADDAGAPEEYADFDMPDGVELNGEMSDKLKSLAKELNLSQKQAQRLADLGAEQATNVAKQPAQVLEKASAEWQTQSRNDEEFGGTEFDKNLAVAKKAKDAFSTPELTALLNESKLGSHPEVIRFMYRVGKAMSEDTIVRGGAEPGSEMSRAERLYKNNK